MLQSHTKTLNMKVHSLLPVNQSKQNNILAANIILLYGEYCEKLSIIARIHDIVCD